MRFSFIVHCLLLHKIRDVYQILLLFHLNALHEYASGSKSKPIDSPTSAFFVE